MYRFLIVLLIFIGLPIMAFELDTSVDDEIRKNYNPSALENALPPLPKISPSTYSVQNGVKEAETVKIQINKISDTIDKSTAIRIKKGTKFKVKSNSYLSDATKSGTRFTFSTLTPVTQRYFTVPVGTSISAIVTDSHLPQISGNGGLLEIAIDGIKYNGQYYYANGKVTKVNRKKVFVNNIKGKRQYLKGVANQVNKGEKFYQKTRRASAKLSNNPVGMFISPIPTIFGTGVYAVNLITSPITAIRSKGARVSIPSGSEFEIKILEDIYLK